MKKKTIGKESKSEASSYKDHPRIPPSNKPILEEKSFMDYLSPDNINGLLSIFIYRILLSVFSVN